MSSAEIPFLLNYLAAFQFLAVTLYAIFLDIARYAFGKMRINLLAINIEISSNSNDRFGINALATGTKSNTFIFRHGFTNLIVLRLWQKKGFINRVTG